MCSEDSLTDYSGDSDTVSLYKETRMRLRDIREGLSLVLQQKALAWRVLFLALETAQEDSVVSVVLPLLSLFSPSIFARGIGDALTANIWATCLIAAGKGGGSLGGALMSRLWRPPVSPLRSSIYRNLFWCVLASAASLLLLPLALLLKELGIVSRAYCIALMFIASSLFFACSSAPKAGFASLLQGLVSSQQVACKIFGFVGAFVTIVDALVILGVNALFFCLLPQGPIVAVVAVSSLFFIHGLLEAFLGPLLVLDPDNDEEGGPLEGAPYDDPQLERNHNNPTINPEQSRSVHTPHQLEALLQRDGSVPSTACTST